MLNTIANAIVFRAWDDYVFKLKVEQPSGENDTAFGESLAMQRLPHMTQCVNQGLNQFITIENLKMKLFSIHQSPKSSLCIFQLFYCS